MLFIRVKEHWEAMLWAVHTCNSCSIVRGTLYSSAAVWMFLPSIQTVLIAPFIADTRHWDILASLAF